MTTASNLYQPFLSAVTQKQWQRIGLARRAGVSTPLFSICSRKSIGLGELPDLKLLVDWCRKTRMSIIQLLPMNDTGFNFRPYDAQSTFALDSMYLSLEELAGVDAKHYQKEIAALRKQFPAGTPRVNYQVKKAKLEILWKMFQNISSAPEAFQNYIEGNRYWLEDFAFFKVLKEINREAEWEDWEKSLREKEPAAIDKMRRTNGPRLQFHRWLQWQLHEQFSAVKNYARKKKVFLMGDLPFLVSRDSADVWSHQSYFKLELVSGAPPDAFFSGGQRWGMPPYNWQQVESHGFDYLIEKIKYADNFYDMFRIDHVVGAFRLWTIPATEPAETQGLNGHFDPSDEPEWEAHGRKLLSVMVQHAAMLPCAEDLGVVPECSYRTLSDFAIPGMEVQRWTKEWQSDCSFKVPEKFRLNAMAVISNHDMTSFHGWWTFEAGTVDGELFKRKCLEKGLDYESSKEKLFDLGSSFYGRLRWKKEIRGAGALPGLLGLPQDQIGDILKIYFESADEKARFWNFAGLEGEPEEKSSPKLLRAALEKISQTSSVFSIQLFQDLLDAGPLFEHDAWDYRINFPGTVGEQNWSLVIPVRLVDILKAGVNRVIKKIHELGDRI